MDKINNIDREYNGIEVLLGKRCNNNCRVCSICSPQDIDYNSEKIKKQLLIGKKNRKNSVMFSGGEPTLYKKLFDYITLAKSMGYENIVIASNGRRFSYKDYCLKIINAGANIFFISIHSTNEDIHDYITRVKGSCRQEIKGIKNLLKFNISIIINLVVTKYNDKHLFDTINMLVKLGIININVRMVIPEGKAERSYHRFASRLSNLRFYFNRIINEKNFRQLEIMFERLPFCLMNEYRNIEKLPFMVLPNLEDWDGFKENLSQYNEYKKINRLLFKPDKCKLCRLFNYCPGIFKKYLGIFGIKTVTSEIIPFR